MNERVVLTQEMIDNSPSLQSQGSQVGDIQEIITENEDEEYPVPPQLPDERPGIEYNPEIIQQDLDNDVFANNIIDSMLENTDIVILPSGERVNIRKLRDKGADTYDMAAMLARGAPFQEFDNLVDATLAGVNTGIATTLGLPVDAAQGAINLGSGVINKVTGSNIPKIENSFGGSESIKGLMGKTGTETVDDEIMDVVPSQRGNVRGGKVFGEASSMLLPITGLATTTSKYLKPITDNRYVRPVLDKLGKNPSNTFSKEVSAISSAATTAGGLQDYFPESDFLAPFVGEIIGASINPTGYIKDAGGMFFRQIGNVVRNFSTEGKAKSAGKFLNEAFKQTNEDPEKVLKMLDKKILDTEGNVIDFNNMTSGQKTKSDALLQIENSLAKKNVEFSKSRQDGFLEGMEALKQAIIRLSASGDPNDLKVAIKLEEQYFKKAIDDKLNIATKKAKESTDQLSGGNSKQASTETFETIDTVIKDLRATETSLWSIVPRTMVVNSGRTKTAIEKAESMYMSDLGEPGLPEWVKNFKLKSEGKLDTPDVATRSREEAEALFQNTDDLELSNVDPSEINVDYLLKLRTSMLENARQLRGGISPDPKRARMFDEIAGAILTDLGNLGRKKAGKVVDAEKEAVLNAITTARNFSFQLQKTVMKTDAADITRLKGNDGRSMVAPNKTLEVLGEGTPIDRENKFNELDNITKFANENIEDSIRESRKDISVPTSATGDLITTIPQQEEYLRTLVSKTIDVNTGRASSKSLREFARDNADLLTKFPVLSKKIANAADNETSLTAIIKEIEVDKAKFIGQEALAKTLGTDDPVEAVMTVLKGTNPESGLDRLISVAQTPEIKLGLQASILEGFKNEATKSGNFDFVTFAVKTREPITTRGTDIITTMINKGIMNKDQGNNLKLILDEGVALVNVAKNNYDVDKLLGETSMLGDLLIRYAGATGGGALPGSTGSPLVMSAFGVRLSQNIFEKLPNDSITKVLIDASRDPVLMRSLLEKNVTDSRAFENAKTINTYLISAGLVEAEELIDDTGQMLFDEAS